MFLVTYGANGVETAHEVAGDEIDSLITSLRALPELLDDGDFVQIRRADYLDTKRDVEVVSERPKFTLIQGGRHS